MRSKRKDTTHARLAQADTLDRLREATRRYDDELSTGMARSLDAVNDRMRDLVILTPEWARGTDQLSISLRAQMVPSLTFAQEAMFAFRDEGVNAFGQIHEAMGYSIAQAVVYGQSVGAAVQAALKATLASIAGESAVRAIYNTALGFYYLATHQYKSAHDAFRAAALFGVAAGTAAIAGRAIPGGGEGIEGPRPYAVTGATPPVLAPGALAAQQPPSGQRTVIVLDDRQAGHYVASLPNRQVEVYDERLLASHTKRPGPAA